MTEKPFSACCRASSRPANDRAETSLSHHPWHDEAVHEPPGRPGAPLIGIVDGHNDLPWRLRSYDYDLARLDLGHTQSEGHTDLPRARQGGLVGQFWSVFVPGSFRGADAVTATLQQVDFVHELVARYPEDLTLVTSAAGLRECIDAGAGGPIASLLGAEGGHSIDNSLGVLRNLYRLGVRYLTLTHNENNDWADAATDEPRHHGLTDFGRSVVAEMNRLGMMVDLSHTAPATMHAALDASRAPVIFSHSSCRAVHDHPRNVPDDVLRRLHDTDGIVMVTFVPKFVTGEPRARIADVVAHVEHAREVAGLDHIGIGGDYDGVAETPHGLEDVSSYPRLLAALADRGWSRRELEKLAHGNLVRVMDRVEHVAARLRAATEPQWQALDSGIAAAAPR